MFAWPKKYGRRVPRKLKKAWPHLAPRKLRRDGLWPMKHLKKDHWREWRVPGSPRAPNLRRYYGMDEWHVVHGVDHLRWSGVKAFSVPAQELSKQEINLRELAAETQRLDLGYED